MAGAVPAKGPDPSATRAARWLRRVGAGGRLTARRVRWSRPGLHPAGVHRRCDQRTTGDALRAGGRHPGLLGPVPGVRVPVRPAAHPVHRQAQRVPGQPEGQGGLRDAVRSGAAAAGGTDHLCQHAAGERAGGALQPDSPGPPDQDDAAARDQRPRVRERVPARVSGAAQPALREAGAGAARRTSAGGAQPERAGGDLQPAARATGKPEPGVPVPGAGVPDPGQAGPPRLGWPAGDGVRGTGGADPGVPLRDGVPLGARTGGESAGGEPLTGPHGGHQRPEPDRGPGTDTPAPCAATRSSVAEDGPDGGRSGRGAESPIRFFSEGPSLKNSAGERLGA